MSKRTIPKLSNELNLIVTKFDAQSGVDDGPPITVGVADAMMGVGVDVLVEVGVSVATGIVVAVIVRVGTKVGDGRLCGVICVVGVPPPVVPQVNSKVEKLKSLAPP